MSISRFSGKNLLNVKNALSRIFSAHHSKVEKKWYIAIYRAYSCLFVKFVILLKSTTLEKKHQNFLTGEHFSRADQASGV